LLTTFDSVIANCISPTPLTPSPDGGGGNAEIIETELPSPLRGRIEPACSSSLSLGVEDRQTGLPVGRQGWGE